MGKEISESPTIDETTSVSPDFDVWNLLAAKPSPAEDKNAMDKPSVKDSAKDGKEATPASKNELTAYDVMPAKPGQPAEDKNAMDKPSVKDSAKDGKEATP
ncbi:MAG: hypothetical protein K2W95_02175, partial [Candidatus Obscuribacterales bacterium]|nr:hypothetical protein [Candidatus Obscuribacterales bacterium]